jgi:hypothetical protein
MGILKGQESFWRRIGGSLKRRPTGHTQFLLSMGILSCVGGRGYTWF